MGSYLNFRNLAFFSKGYLGYFLPLPVILSALRSGPAAGRKTMTSTFFLLLSAPPLLGFSPPTLWPFALSHVCVHCRWACAS